MKRILSAIALSLIFASAAGAQTYRSQSRVIVTGLGGDTFSVPTGGTYGATGAWCAAADYAIRILNARGVARLYVQQPKTTPSGAVVFGLTPGGTVPVTVASIDAALRSAGANLSVDHAYQSC
ncbi:MAG: hypothetical protein HKN30_05040, partial [Sulfitobacter sp.]|nr:hypothetical protein [Sulfitobacter sp.]